MKLSEWAKRQGIQYKTAWKWYRDGKLPVPAEQMPTGTIIVREPHALHNAKVAIYARVSSADQRNDLDGQVARTTEFTVSQGFSVSQVVKEVGSGLNGHRPKLMKLLADHSVSVIAVEHRDRLMRFGCEYVESALAAQGRKLIVANSEEMKDDLVWDMIEVLTSFCARLYGRRSAEHRAKKALEAAAKEG